MATRGNFAAGPQGPPGLSTGPAGGDLGGNYPDPTLQNTVNVQSVVRTNSLDQMTAPAANVNMNSKKLTNLANGTSAQDAATFGQIPASLPPSGSASGDLAGTYPAPTLANTASVQSVVRTNRLDQMAAPQASVSMNSQKLINLAQGTNSNDAVTFSQIPGALPPNGPASGDLTGTYPSPTLANTTNVQSVVRTNRLDQMAAPTNPVSFNSQKITNLANGTAATDGATFGQIPTTLPPSGSATGDLSGTYPAPSVAKINGISASGTPAIGQSLFATSTSASAWSYNPHIFASTGMLSGGVMNFGTSTNQFTISAGIGVIADYVTNPSNPTITRVTISAQTITITGTPATRTTNWWLVDSTGTVTAQGTAPTNVQRRTSIVLGVTGSVIGTGDLFNVQTIQVSQQQPLGQLYDLMYALGPFSTSGNIISANGVNLNMNKSAGNVFDTSFATGTAPNNPHMVASPAETPMTFRYATQVSGSQGSLVTAIDPSHYDLNGTVTLMPGGGGTATVQRIFLFGTGVSSAQLAIQYGNTIYTSLANATASVGNGTGVGNFPINPDFTDIGIFIGWLCVTKNATDLTNTGQAAIIPAAKFASP